MSHCWPWSHDWERWSEPVKVRYFYPQGYDTLTGNYRAEEVKFIRLVQRRTCKRCGVEKRRTLPK